MTNKYKIHDDALFAKKDLPSEARLRLFAAVIEQAIKDACLPRKTADQSASINQLQCSAVKWIFDDPKKRLKYFCDWLGWEIEYVRKKTQELMEKSDLKRYNIYIKKMKGNPHGKSNNIK